MDAEDDDELGVGFLFEDFPALHPAFNFLGCGCPYGDCPALDAGSDFWPGLGTAPLGDGDDGYAGLSPGVFERSGAPDLIGGYGSWGVPVDGEVGTTGPGVEGRDSAPLFTESFPGDESVESVVFGEEVHAFGSAKVGPGVPGLWNIGWFHPYSVCCRS